MPSTETAASGVPIALVYQAQALHVHLKQALSELGARVVYDSPAAAFDRGALNRSGAEVVVINLDPQVDEEIAQLDDLLDDDQFRVIFNDGEVSSRLEGWDQARWARHLASKILGMGGDTNPPRPIGSHAISVKVKQTASEYPGSPAGTGSFELLGNELADALAADTSESISRTRAALVTKEEPVAPQFEVAPTRNETPTLEIPVREWMAGIPDGAQLTQASLDEPHVAATAPAALIAEFDNLPPEADETPAVVDETPAMVDEFDLVLQDFDLPNDFNDGAEVPAVAAESAMIDEEFDLGDFGLAQEPADSPKPAVEGDFGEFDLGALNLEPLDDSVTDDGRPATVREAPPSGLDELLFGLSLEALEDADAPRANTGSKPAPAATPKISATPAVASPAPAAVPAAKPNRDLASFDLSSLALTPMDDEVIAPPTSGRASYKVDESERKAVAPPPPVAAAAPPPPQDDDDFSLDALEFKLDEDSEFDSVALLRNNSDAGNQGSEADLMAELDALVAHEEPTAAPGLGPIRRVWVLGASIGGPEAVREFLGALPADTPALFLLAQHMGADFVDLMSQQLAKATRLRVRSVASGDRVAYGEVVVVPLGERILIDTQGDVKLAALNAMSPYSPSIDQVLTDVADRFGAGAGAIIFSGMAHDAIDGSVYLAGKGGTVWTQDPATCVISSMVDGARDAGVVKFVGAPLELARQFQVDVIRAG